MATSSTILIGHPLGANKLDEAKDNGYKLLVFGEILSIIFGFGMFCSQYLIHFVYPNVSSEALELAKQFLRCMGLLYWIYTFNCQCYFTLRAGGDTKSTMYMDSGFMWCVNIPLVICLAYFTKIPVYEVYIIGQLTDIIKGFVSFRMVRKEKWVRNLAIENE